MKCAYWKKIQNAMDHDDELSSFALHLEECSFCRRRVELYWKFTGLYAAELSNPSGALFQGVRRNPSRHPFRWLAAAAVFSLSLFFSGLYLPGYLEVRSLQKEFAMELAAHAFEGGLMEGSDTVETGYSLRWF